MSQLLILTDDDPIWEKKIGPFSLRWWFLFLIVASTTAGIYIVKWDTRNSIVGRGDTFYESLVEPTILATSHYGHTSGPQGSPLHADDQRLPVAIRLLKPYAVILWPEQIHVLLKAPTQGEFTLNIGYDEQQVWVAYTAEGDTEYLLHRYLTENEIQLIDETRANVLAEQEEEAWEGWPPEP